MLKLSILGWIALVIVVLGGIDLGLLGAIGLDLTHFFFAPMSWGSRTCYVVVGLASIYLIYDAIKSTRKTQ